MSIFLLVLGLILIIGLICIHEFGHFVAARRNGVEVEEYGIGFPPRAWHKKTKGGWDFSINWLPLGGFVRLKGAHDTDKDKGGFGQASLWVKTKIMVAGVGMNLLAAFVILTILAWVGLPQLINNQFTIGSDTKVVSTKTLVGEVIPHSPAAKIGLQENDQLIQLGKVGGPLKSIGSDQQLISLTPKYAGQRVEIVYKQGSKTVTANTTLLTTKVVNASANTNNPKGYLGIVPLSFSVQRSTWSAPITALGIMKQYTILTFKGLWSAVKGLGSTIAGLVTRNKVARQAGQTEATSEVSGPVGVYKVLRSGSSIGYQYMLFIIAILSLSLAIINILFIPALDGGRLFLILVSRSIRRPMKQNTEDVINGIGFAVLMALVVLVSISDIRR